MKKYIIVIPAQLQEEANLFCESFTDGGLATFKAGLSSNGKLPTTHYIADWNMNKAEEFAMKSKYIDYMYEQNAEEVLTLLSLKKINVLEEV